MKASRELSTNSHMHCKAVKSISPSISNIAVEGVMSMNSSKLHKKINLNINKKNNPDNLHFYFYFLDFISDYRNL